MKSSSLHIRLASVPRFCENEYHPTQVKLYSEFTRLVFQALTLPSVSRFIRQLTESLGLGRIEIRIMRLPSRRSRAAPVLRGGSIRVVGTQLKGRTWVRKRAIDIYPDLLWPDRRCRPSWQISPRGFILNSSIKALIHEILHLSGLRNEDEVGKLTEHHCKTFRTTSLDTFDEELKPLLKIWRQIIKKFSL